MTIDIFGRIAAGSAIALSALILGSTSLAAQQTPEVITLEEAIAIALERNPSIRQSQNSARSSELTVLQQQKQLLPDLSFSSGTGVPYLTGGPGADPAITAGISTNVQVGNLYSTVANLKQARLNVEVSQENLTRTRQTIIFNVMSNYLSLVEAQDQIDVQERNLSAVEEQERQIQIRVTAGERPISDLYQQQASTASARLSLVQSNRGLIVSRMNLIRLLQLDPNGEYEFVRPELGPLSTNVDSLDLQTLSSQAFAQRPDLRASQISLASAEQGVRIAEATRWPSLSLSLGYNTGNFNSSSGGGLFNQWDEGRRGSLSLNVSVPILDFTYGITKERAQIALENARISLDNARQNVAVEVRTAYLDLQLAEEQLVVAEAQMQAAQLALQTAQQRYEVGAATLLEQVQAQLAHQRAATTLVNAQYELVFQSRLMAYYLGDLSTGGE